MGRLQKIVKNVRSFEGMKECIMYKGTLRWRIEDDQGRVHVIKIPNSYYMPEGHS